MNKELFKYEIKSNYNLFFIFIALLTMYITIINSMFNPELGSILNEMAESMPQFFALFGMLNMGTSLVEFYITYLYGFILIVIPLVFYFILVNNLLAKHTDKQTLAYFLNTGYSRKQIIVNQIVILLISHLLVTVYITGLMILVGHLSYPSEVIVSDILQLNGYLFLLHLSLSSFALLCGSYFNDLKYSVGIPAVSIIFFVLLKMLTQVSDRISLIKYFNPLSLFNPNLVVSADLTYLVYAMLLLVSSLSFLCLAIKIFVLKDLHL